MMNKMLVAGSSLAKSYSLPHQAFTLEGVEFNPNDDYWQLSYNKNASFEAFTNVSSRFKAAVKNTLMVLLSNSNFHSSMAGFVQFKNLFNSLDVSEGVEVDFIEVGQLLYWVQKGKNARYLGQLRIFLNAAETLGANLLSQSAQAQLEQIKLVDNGAPYEDIVIWHPIRGPYRPSEDKALKIALDDAFQEGAVKLREYFVCRLFRGFGLRPEQLAQMKVADLRFGQNGFTIRIPQIKQRSSTRRSQFMPWKPATQGFANLAKLYLDEYIYPNIADRTKVGSAPLVINKQQTNIEPDDGLTEHVSADHCYKIYKITMTVLEVISPLTGELINVSPRRERHTFATQLAMNGATAAEIAINLGQSNATSCEAYIDASIEHYQRMEALVGEAFVPIADRFLGKIVASKQANNLEFALYDMELEQVGTCSTGGCSAVDTGVAPLACYTCRKFNAWEDGPHREFLNCLLAEQHTLRKKGHSTVAETKSETIVAIRDLLEAIRQRRRSENG